MLFILVNVCFWDFNLINCLVCCKNIITWTIYVELQTIKLSELHWLEWSLKFFGGNMLKINWIKKILGIPYNPLPRHDTRQERTIGTIALLDLSLFSTYVLKMLIKPSFSSQDFQERKRNPQTFHIYVSFVHKKIAQPETKILFPPSHSILFWVVPK